MYIPKALAKSAEKSRMPEFDPTCHINWKLDLHTDWCHKLYNVEGSFLINVIDKDTLSHETNFDAVCGKDTSEDGNLLLNTPLKNRNG